MKSRILLSIGFAAAVSMIAGACGSDAEDETRTAVSDVAESLPSVDTMTVDSLSTISEEDVEERVDDVADALSAGDFTTTLDLLELSGISAELEGREVTVLAPSESAFTELSAEELTAFVTDADRARELMRRHVLDGAYTFDELSGLTEVTTISGDTLTVSAEGDALTIDGATVSPPDADALDGDEGQEAAVFGIDRLLVDE